MLGIIQKIIQDNYFHIDRFMDQFIDQERKPYFLSKQGFSGRINKKPVDLDSLFSIDPDKINRPLIVNLETPPNLFYFDLFESLTNSLEIKVIYLITPKSKHYHSGMKEMNYEKIIQN